MTKLILALMTFGFVGAAQADFGEIHIMIRWEVLNALEKADTIEENAKVKLVPDEKENRVFIESVPGGPCDDYDYQAKATYNEGDKIISSCTVCFMQEDTITSQGAYCE